MGEMRVNRASNDLAIYFSEALSFVGKVNDLGWANESEVQRIEKEKKPLSFEIVKTDFFEASVIDIVCSAFEERSDFSYGRSDSSGCHFGYDQNIQQQYAQNYLYYMSNKSASQSSNGSAASLKKCVEQLLIESDEEEKNMRKIANLKNEFPVLKKINPTLTNNDKLQLFVRDNQFKQRVLQKLIEKGLHLEQGVPILKAYLISTRFKSQVQQQFDESDLINVFQKFGHLNQIFVYESIAYVAFQQLHSVYICMKVLNQFQVNEKTRMRVRFCSEEEHLQAHSAFYTKSRGMASSYYASTASSGAGNSQGGIPQLKYIIKFQFGVENMPQFNISQRIIGPKGSYMKKIIEKMLSRHPLAHKYNIGNIDSVFKMRIRGKGSGYLESGQQSEQRLHLFISSKQKWMYESACQEIQILLVKVFQDYKISFQRQYRQHAKGIAYKILQYEGNYYNQIKRVYLSEIEQVVDLISLENQGKLSQKVIQQKISQRQGARKQGKFQQADQIRNWLKSKGVILVDPKYKGGKTTWHYMKL